MICPGCGSRSRRVGEHVGRNYPPHSRTQYRRCVNPKCEYSQRNFAVFQRVVLTDSRKNPRRVKLR